MKTICKEFAYKDLVRFIAAIILAPDNHLGCFARKELSDANANLRKITTEVLTAVGMFKLLISKFYRCETEKSCEIFTAQGFKYYSLKSVIRTQTGLINLLYSFKANLTDAMRPELAGKNIPNNILDSTTANATVPENANSIQEVLKSNTSAKIAAGITLYQRIFMKVSGICVIARGHFTSSASKKAIFNIKKMPVLLPENISRKPRLNWRTTNKVKENWGRVKHNELMQW